MSENYQALVAAGDNAQIPSATPADSALADTSITDVVVLLESVGQETNPVDQYRILREAYAKLGNIIIPRYRARKVQHNFQNNNQPRTGVHLPVPAGASPIFAVPLSTEVDS